VIDLFEQPRQDLTEPEVESRLGVCRQTLRNWRVGYTIKGKYYESRLTEDVEWYKLRKTKRSPVLYRIGWVEQMEQALKNAGGALDYRRHNR